MVNYKDLGLVNTREMFAKAIKGGYVKHGARDNCGDEQYGGKFHKAFCRVFFNACAFQTPNGILFPSEPPRGLSLRQTGGSIAVQDLFKLGVCHPVPVSCMLFHMEKLRLSGQRPLILRR